MKEWGGVAEGRVAKPFPWKKFVLMLVCVVVFSAIVYMGVNHGIS